MINALHSKRIRLTGIATVTLVRFAFALMTNLAGSQRFTASDTVTLFLFTLGNTIVAWELNRLLVVWLTRRHGVRRLGGARFATEIALVILLNTFVFAIHLTVAWLLQPGPMPKLLNFLFELFDRWVFGLLFTGFYELLVFVHAMKGAQKEAEELKKLNVTIQLESLKNQVKPHFLFNSLNTLTGLVENNSGQAVRFIAELSSVYRYLLQSSEKELIALSDELQFSRAYFFLLQMRFGAGIQLVENVHSTMENCLLPPLTLQMLLENCIKHNQVSERKPLLMEIATEETGWLVVRNNLQRKRNPHSNGMGLSNIAAKLKLLNQPAIEVQETETHFTIKIPLIKTAVYESAHH